MAKGFGLDATNDIIIGGTSFTRTDNADHLAQKLRSKLQLVQGESQLDVTAGIAYFTDIFVKPVNLPGVASIFKSEIINTEGVNELLRFDYDLDTTQRELTIGFSINTIYGDLNINNLTINIGA
jgi:hypothetical protein